MGLGMYALLYVCFMIPHTDTKKLCTIGTDIGILYDHSVQLGEGTTIIENIGIWYRHFGYL